MPDEDRGPAQVTGQRGQVAGDVGAGDRRPAQAGLAVPAQVLQKDRGQLAAGPCTAPSGLIARSTRAARDTVITFGTPPGISSPSTACSRQTTWVRVRPRSRYRLDQIFSTAA